MVDLLKYIFLLYFICIFINVCVCVIYFRQMLETPAPVDCIKHLVSSNEGGRRSSPPSSASLLLDKLRTFYFFVFCDLAVSDFSPE